MKKIKAFILCAAVLLSLCSCGTPAAVTDTGSTESTAAAADTLEVPDFSGLTRDQIQMKYPKLNIIYDETYGSKPEGEMVSQDPAAGTVIGFDDQIIVEISIGEKLVEVDDYAGRSITDAQTLIEKQGLMCEVVRVDDDTVQKNCVIRTLPSARTKVEKGSVITCYVSLGSSQQEIRVPQMLGETIEDATKLATENNITLQISYDDESEVEPGIVISQSIDADTIVEPDTRVGVVISGENAGAAKETSISVTLKKELSGEYELKYYIDGTLQENKTEIKELSLTKKINWDISGTDVHTYSIRVTCLATGKSGILYEMEVDFTQDPPVKNHHDTFNANIFDELSRT